MEWIRLNHAHLCDGLVPESSDTKPWALLMVMTHSIGDIRQSFIPIHVWPQMVLRHCSVKFYPSNCHVVLEDKGQSYKSLLLNNKVA